MAKVNTKTILGGAEEAVDKIAGSQFIKNVKTTVAELDENMARLSSQGKLFQVPFARNMTDRGIGNEAMNSKVTDAFAGLFEDLGLEGEELAKAQKIAKSANSENLDQIFGDIQSNFGGKLDKYKESVQKIFESQAKQDTGEKSLKEMMGNINYYANIPKAYFNPADPKVRSDRIKAAVGGYAGVAIGGRVLQGGTLTTNEYGERDIAGIPFV